MGVPTFFRWITLRYPKCVVDAKESKTQSEVPKIDNLYLDMNGIIHPCCNPPDGEKPQSESQMFQNIFEYVEQLVRIVKPHNLVYMAIDGVAPRAKMNQQRARRYRKVQEEREKPVQETKSSYKFDSNVITPGTPFMHRLAEALHEWIVQKLENEWKNLTVVFSDSNVPGEGEHKLLEFVRVQRTQPGYNPNTKHCIYGADADLIMLSLITHEAHFYIIRENVMDFQKVTCRICGQQGHFDYSCMGKAKEKSGNFDEQAPIVEKCKFQFLKVPVLREYLYYEFGDLTKFPHYDFERIIDDFVFLCFFVGNDFLPHLPSLNIRDGAIDGLIYLYSKIFHRLGGYLTENGKVVLYRIDIIFAELARIEEEFFKQKQAREDYFKQRRQPVKRKRVDTEEGKNIQIAERVVEEVLEDQDTIRLGEEGWKRRYYNEKFKVSGSELEEFRQRIHHSYVEGLCWVFEYYYSGCQSWGWFYPFHYAPFASDLYNSHLLQLKFDIGKPFKPFSQLLSVLPPESAFALPDPLKELVTEPASEIIDFYPCDFKLDKNGKRFAWQGVMLLPFIEEKRLLNAIEAKEERLSEEEKLRNSLGETLMFAQKQTNLRVVLKGTTPKNPKYKLPPGKKTQMNIIENPQKSLHSSQKLPGAVDPKNEIDNIIFRSGDRKGFGGYSFINLVTKFMSADIQLGSWMAEREDPFPQFTRSYNNTRSVQAAPFQPPPKAPKPNPSPQLIANLQRLQELLSKNKPSS